MDRALVFGTRGWGFESLRAHNFFLFRVNIFDIRTAHVVLYNV